MKMDHVELRVTQPIYLHAARQNTLILPDWVNSIPRDIMDRATCY